MVTKRSLRSSSRVVHQKKLKGEEQVPVDNVDSPSSSKKTANVKSERAIVDTLNNSGSDTKIGTGTPRFWLMKAESTSRIENGHDVKFSIDDLKRLGSDCWDGVRNAEASKTMAVRMSLNDRVFFYHSNAGSQTGIAGLATICKEGYPDESAWDRSHAYFDPKSDPAKPRWYRVDVKYERHLKRLIGLQELKRYKETKLCKMVLLRRPQLSVQPVSQEEWDFIMSLENQSEIETEDHAKSPARLSKKRATSKKAVTGKLPHDKKRSEMTDEEIKAEINFTHGG